MSQFQSRLDKFRAMTDAGSLLHLNTWRSFRQATEQLNRLTRSVPDDKDKLAKDQEIWVEAFSKAMDTWERHRRKANKLGIDTNIDDQFAVVVVEAERMQAEWVGRTAMRLVFQVSVMEVEVVEQAVVPAAETRKASSKAVSVASSTRKRVWEEDEEGVAAKSATIKCKVSAPAVQLVSTEGACKTCKKAGVAAECAYGTGTACAQCKLAKLRCSLAQGQHGQRKPTEAAGSLAAVAVVVETTKNGRTVQPLAKASPSKRAPSPIKVDNESEAEGEMTLAHLKGKACVVPKKTGGKSEARQTQDALAHHLNHLHSRLFQIRAKVKELEVEQAMVMSEVSKIVEALEDMDL